MISESRSGHPPLMMTHIAMFVAIGVVAGLLLSGIPNVELVTAVCFISGYLLGRAAGLMTGALTEALFAGFHPLGSSIGILLAAQIVGMSVNGLFGALASRFTRRGRNVFQFGIPIVVFGILGTLVFDILTNLAFPIMAGFSFSQTAIALFAGLPFAVIHLISNTVIFILIVVPILPRLQKALRLP